MSITSDSEIQRNFCKLLDIPLQPGNAFEEQLNLLNACAPVLGTSSPLDRWKQWQQTCSLFPTVDALNNWTTQLIHRIVGTLKATAGFKNLENDELKKYEVTNFPSKPNTFAKSNEGETLYSIDLIQANYQAMNEYDPTILNTKSYEELLARFTNDPVLMESKQFRQIIFGLLSPNKLGMIQRFLISREIGKLASLIATGKIVILGATNDEYIVEVLNGETSIFNVLDFQLVRVSSFVMKEVILSPAPKGKILFDVFYQDFIPADGKCKCLNKTGHFGPVCRRRSTCMPSYLTCQIYRQIFQHQPPTESDRRAYVDQFPCLLDPVILKSSHEVIDLALSSCPMEKKSN